MGGGGVGGLSEWVGVSMCMCVGVAGWLGVSVCGSWVTRHEYVGGCERV